VQLRGSALEHLSGEELEHLASALIDAERVASGLEPGDRKSLGVPNRSDGGIDCLLTRSPLQPTDFFRRGPLVFQFKRSWSSWRPSGVAKAAREWLRRGAGYCLIVTDALGSDEQVKSERKLRASLAKAVGREVKDVSLVAHEGLVTWLSRHPSLWARVPGLTALRHLRTWEQWSQEELHPAGTLPWTRDPARAMQEERLRLGVERGEVWRVTGPPGVGKTRFVLEALRTLAPAVSYLPRYSDEVLDLVGSSTPLYGVLVVDQCTEEEERTIRRLRRATSLAIVSICSADDALAEPDETTVRLEPLEHEATEQLARAAAPQLPLEVRFAVAQESGGYPQLIRLFLDAVAAAPPERGLAGVSLSRKDLVRELRRFLEPGDPEAGALSALALPTIVTFHEDSDEPEALARTFGIDEARLGEMRQRLVQRHAASEAGKSVYVSPKVLGDWLALGTWRRHGSRRLLEKLVEAGAGGELLSKCLRRLELGTDEARQILLELASDPHLLVGSVGLERVAQLVSRLARTHPQASVGLSRRLLRVDGEELSKETWSAELARAVAIAGGFDEAFEPAADLLAQALVESPETDARLLSDMFAARLGQTLASHDRRLRWLRNLAADPRPGYRLVAIACATAACQAAATHALSILPGGRSSLRSTHSIEEDRDYRLAAARLLQKLMDAPEADVRRQAGGSVAIVLRGLVRDHLAEVGVALVEGFVHSGPEPAELRAVLHVLGIVERFDEPRLPAQQQAAVGRIKALLQPRNLTERVARVLAHPGVPDDEPDPELLSTAADLVATPDDQALDYLFRSNPGEGFELGRCAGQLDAGRHLLEPIRRRAALRDASLWFAAAYFRDLSGEPAADDILDTWSLDSALCKLVFEATSRRPPSPRAATRLVSMVQRKALPASHLEALRSGAWLGTLPPDDARKVLEAAMAEPTTALLLASQLSQLGDGAGVLPELKAAWSSAGRAIPDRHDLAWEWSRVARRIARDDPQFVVDVCIDLLRSPETRDRAHIAEVLGPLLSGAPRMHWVRFGEVLESLDEEWQQTLGLMIRGHLREEPALTDEIVRWAKAGEAKRPALAAYLVAAVSQAEGNLAAALLDAFPHDQAVLRGVAAAFNSGFWSGNESRWHRERLEALEAFAASGQRGLASWARSLIPETRAEYEHALKVEGAWRAGALDLPRHSDRPILDRLFGLAIGQEGLFTTDQARREGCSRQLLDKYLRSGKVRRVMRGVYRLTNFPRGEHEDLVAIWLRFGAEAIFSHTTALLLHRLSTALPEKAHITLPEAWSQRRLRIPGGVVVHYADVPRKDCTQVGPVWVTTVPRTIADCETSNVAREIVREAREEARERGLLPEESSAASGGEQP
jgi:hypothetical protein